MASWLTTAYQVLLALDNIDFGLSDEEDRDFEGLGVYGYLHSDNPEPEFVNRMLECTFFLYGVTAYR